MHFPKHWIRELVQENGLETYAYGWSDRSIEEASDKARENAKKIIRRLGARETMESYGYPRGVMREEVVERFESENGEEAIISRNRYGALVLNAARTMFVDIDSAQERTPQTGLMGSILRLFKEKPAEAADPLEKKKSEIEKTLIESRLRAAMYQTRAGIRLLILNGTFDPAANETRALLLRLKSDPLYIQLTQNQKCFRARLTPKPWRIGLPNPPAVYPLRDSRETNDYQTWTNQYMKMSGGFGICKYMGEIGIESQEDPQPAYIRRLHDQYCLRENLPLA